MFRASELDRLISKVQLVGLETIECVIASVISDINTAPTATTESEATDAGTALCVEGQEVGEDKTGHVPSQLSNNSLLAGIMEHMKEGVTITFPVNY